MSVKIISCLSDNSLRRQTWEFGLEYQVTLTACVWVSLPTVSTSFSGISVTAVRVKKQYNSKSNSNCCRQKLFGKALKIVWWDTWDDAMSVSVCLRKYGRILLDWNEILTVRKCMFVILWLKILVLYLALSKWRAGREATLGGRPTGSDVIAPVYQMIRKVNL